MRKENGVLISVENKDIKLLDKNPEKFWKGVTNIRSGAFLGVDKLTNIKIPEEVINIESNAFNLCKNLKNVMLPNGITIISVSAFNMCSNLTNITIPEGVISIGNDAFGDCSNLTSLEIPENVITVGERAFFNVPKVIVNGKSIFGDLLTNELFDAIKSNQNINLKPLNKIYQIVKEKGLDVNNIREFVVLCANLGMLEPVTTKLQNSKLKNGEPNYVSVCNVAYTFLQGVLNKNNIKLNELHENLREMKLQGYNEAFMKFVISNWSDVKNNMSLLPKVYDWFSMRANLDVKKANPNGTLPTTDENRFKVLDYETAENGIDKMHWHNPTMKNLLKEFVKKEFTNIETPRDEELASEIVKYNIYTQKHFDKAKEIDRERIKLNVQNILKKTVKQNQSVSLNNYYEKTKVINQQILQDSAEVLNHQIKDTASLFTYEVLSKSDPANFVMGCLTSCCATLYGTGGGAMRAMIIHPNIQPLVIRDFNQHIISFGIIYVNRQEGYAVVNNFEVNRRYDDYHKQEAIYKKAMEGVRAFVSEYNQENPNAMIKKVTCGVSPNWDAINHFIASHPQSPILEAPNFDDFQYVGSGSWVGDWHRAQYLIYDQKWEDTREK